MRILHANKFNFVSGGADRYFIDLIDALNARGHMSAKFCMDHPSNLPDENSRYFVSRVDFGNGAGLANALRVPGRMAWSREAASKFDRLIRDFRPDLVHIHNIYHQISPSILAVAKSHKLPVVMHLHDYKYMCPNYQMLNRTGICERCRGGHYWNCAKYSCVKGSRAKSLLCAGEMYLHHSLLRVYERNIDLFIASTEFVAEKFREWGGDEKKVKVVTYFIDVDRFKPQTEPGKYFLFFGRLSREKGVITLLRAYRKFLEKRQGSEAPTLKIVGGGEMEMDIRAEIARLQLETQVEMTGPKYGEELNGIIAGCLAVIVPSEWYEASGIVIPEAGAMGKPVIASAIGGIPENIIPGKTGYLFQPGNADELAERLADLASSPQTAKEMGTNANELVRAIRTPNKHLENLMPLYKKLL